MGEHVSVQEREKERERQGEKKTRGRGIIIDHNLKPPAYMNPQQDPQTHENIYLSWPS